MVFVSGGEYNKNGAQIQVSSFYISEFLITQKIWEEVFKEKRKNPSYFKGAELPVEQVSWEDAQAFLLELNSRGEGKNYRLPTEAEWEYAAYGGKYSEGYRYAGSDKLKQVGWYNENSNQKTHEVGLHYPNELGLFDMSGNVWEWCSDWALESMPEESTPRLVNPQGPPEGKLKVVKGGSWDSERSFCSIFNSYFYYPNFVGNAVGFRVVYTPMDSDLLMRVNKTYETMGL